MLTTLRQRLPAPITRPIDRISAWLDESVSTPADPSSWQVDAALQAFVDGELTRALLASDAALAAWRDAYWADDEFLVVPGVLSPSLVARIVAELPALPKVRSVTPWARKAAASGYPLMQRYAPTAVAVYRAAPLRRWAELLAGQPMHLKAEGDPHATAMYYYTKWGDSMRYHVDACGCEANASYTMILGIEDESTQQFLAKLHHADARRPVRKVRVTTAPGDLIFFCGSKLLHAVSPLGRGERRTVQSIAFTNGAPMKRGKHLHESIKDALMYFGPSALWSRHT